MMQVEVIQKDLKTGGWSGRAWLLKAGDKYYVASGVVAMFSGPEVLVFETDDKGNPKSMSEVVGGRGISMLEAVAMLGRSLADKQTEAKQE
ncbi:MAG: hypothetical protein PVH61_31785 [Candidatus Aminicenantes bacterium]|jgi:hypothetical protein